ncbi:uncharacterized protein LOC124154695 [Ischnura elegans]|uniref:uncharacterized protein LOC124154695 n=1 Tax=Ischnura elegans TaxID=197161 RepID=UPI001ED87B06|nr:uncharacterized protein LOC124154695 [Ischnura elegans]
MPPGMLVALLLLGATAALPLESPAPPEGVAAPAPIVEMPPVVDAAEATDTTREEVETSMADAAEAWPRGARAVLLLDSNEVPVRQSALEAAVSSKLRSECARRDASACLKLKLLAYMNKLLKKASIPITDAVEISRTSSEDANEEDETAWVGADGGVEEDEALGVVVAGKVRAFVRSRSLRWTLAPDADLLLTPDARDATVSVGFALRGGRAADDADDATGRGKLKTLLPILAAVKIKIGILVALAIAGLALLVGKAVVISKIALVVAGILGIIKLLSKPQKTVSYEVVSHPHHTYSHGASTVVDPGHHHEGPGYGRRSLEGADLAYRAHASTYR